MNNGSQGQDDLIKLLSWNFKPFYKKLLICWFILIIIAASSVELFNSHYEGIFLLLPVILIFYNELENYMNLKLICVFYSIIVSSILYSYRRSSILENLPIILLNISILIIMILYIYYFIYRSHQPEIDSLTKNPKKIYRKCSRCFMYFQNVIKIICGHFYCTDCYENMVSKQLLRKDASKDIYCLICNKVIETNILIQSKKSNLFYRTKNQDPEVQKFTCRLCNATANSGITLVCNHRYCHLCILKHVEKLIDNSKVNAYDFVCPGCPNTISIEQVKSIISKEYYDKYLNLVIRTYKPQEKGLILKQCIYCGVYIEIPEELEELRCPSCLNLYCLKCNNKHQNITCEDFKLKNEDEEKFLSKYLACPNCHSEVDKNNGCNYLICPCKTRFCSICGKVLKGSHYSYHFKKEGPFGKTCNTLDKIEDGL
ncbi:unnamed protein product [Blepharisma stoltei]|uniref:RING-type domain-containing protein n=1 Tax=Blepharisma stoltei TaxID=1481888 RepID=A0AAU9ILA8_9CILI|nr:unnamed protein product [Blepharisma stoltei]